MKERTLIFDFETNGLLHIPNFQPIEFAALVVDDEKIREQHTLIKCPTPLPQEIVEKIGITDDMLIHGMDYPVFRQKLGQLFTYSNNCLFIGHNIINFDIPVVERILGLTINKNLVYDTAAIFKAKLLNLPIPKTYEEQYKVLKTQRKGIYFNLKAATEHYEIEKQEGDFHRALTDVYYTYEIYKKQNNIT